MVFICDLTSWVRIVPLRHKSECVDVAKNLVKELRATSGRDLSDRVVCFLRMIYSVQANIPNTPGTKGSKA